jgi:cytoplasmic tRNA 2-thiolation protein 2
MESYRFKQSSEDQKRRLFLPVSGGISSLVLLHILDAQLQRQMANRNRTAYDIVVARVVLPEEQESAAVQSAYAELARKFATHTFLPLLALQDALRLDANLDEDLKHIGVVRQDGESDETLLHRMLYRTTSATARSDLQSILLKRLLVSVAKDRGCESVLWGHSDSRLAALALADVAKGRGGSVPSTIADGQSMSGLNFNYPVRDIFKTELRTYAQAISDPFLEKEDESDITVQPPSSLRNTSIDSLLSAYIISQGEKYPGIMSNVVRTASKLETKDANDDDMIACPVCFTRTVKSRRGPNSNSILCYGCERMMKDMKP